MTTVTIIIPCLNEGKTISQVLQAIKKQNYPVDKLDVVIADGLSDDDTRQRINEFRLANPSLPIMVVDNKKREIPAGLNLAIREARGEIIVRMDGHSLPARIMYRAVSKTLKPAMVIMLADDGLSFQAQPPGLLAVSPPRLPTG
jgi:glycosyltransferase involved in cell wall biosynthesis